MHGLTQDDLAHLLPLRGRTLIQISVGEYQVQFAFDGLSVDVEGRCELLAPSGEVLDVWDRGVRSDRFRFLELLGSF